MSDFISIFILSAGCLALFSSFTWILMTGMSVYDSHSQKERDTKSVFLWFLICTAGMWAYAICVAYLRPYSAFVHVAGYISLLLAPVQFYRFIYILSGTDVKPFSLWHYVFPLLLAAILSEWSFFIPQNMQVLLFEKHNADAAGYEAYIGLFFSKPVVCTVYASVYALLSLIRLRKYFRTLDRLDAATGKKAAWIGLLLLFVFSTTLTSIGIAVFPCGLLTGWTIVPTALLLVLLHLALGYTIIRRNFFTYMPAEGENEPDSGFAMRANKNNTHTDKKTAGDKGHAVAKTLTQKSFEAYFREHKPWLNPQLKITDLVEPLNANRTKISNFINQTYGVNFNRYINRLRLKETERLAKLPSNKGKQLSELALQAGFVNNRNYHRAVEAEQNASKDTGTTRNNYGRNK